MTSSSRRNLALHLDEPTKRYDRKAMLAAPLQNARPKLESLDDFAPTLSGGRCYERLIGRERLASLVSTRDDVLATRELPRMDNALLRASLPSSPQLHVDVDIDEAVTGEVRPFAKTEYAPAADIVASSLPSAADPRESETAERAVAVVDEAPSFPIVALVAEPVVEPVAEAKPSRAALAGPGKNKLRRLLSRAATVVGLAAIVVGVYLAFRSPEARLRFSSGASAASAAVVRFARGARDVAIRGVSRIHANVEVSS